MWLAEERAGLAGAVALASSLNYGVSDTSLKMLLPLVSFQRWMFWRNVSSLKYLVLGFGIDDHLVHRLSFNI